MKRNLLGLFAVVLAIAISSFTVSKRANYYVVYKGAPFAQDQIGSYNTPTLSQPATASGTTVLNWFRIPDTNLDGIISQSELGTEFEVLDVVNDLANTLDDDAEITNRLDKK
jgi:hypothetical protein